MVLIVVYSQPLVSNSSSIFPCKSDPFNEKSVLKNETFECSEMVSHQLEHFNKRFKIYSAM